MFPEIRRISEISPISSQIGVNRFNPTKVKIITLTTRLGPRTIQILWPDPVNSKVIVGKVVVPIMIFNEPTTWP
jgi:hypothetical protein